MKSTQMMSDWIRDINSAINGLELFLFSGSLTVRQ